MLRANRLVIDTGLHAQGWSVERAVRWMTGHSPMSDVQAKGGVVVRNDWGGNSDR
jgi:uncharacterized protein (DUF885 family)